MAGRPPDHLRKQLEILAWLDHCEAVGNADAESGVGCYADLLEALAREVESALC
jgi:hypothetical protein